MPIDIRLGGDYRALVITGPNTGGKTVALRTLGLLALMHQSGLHVPAAAGSRGCRSSATSSPTSATSSRSPSRCPRSAGHMRSIVRIVEAAGPDCLVLLDELGAGTDPTEGSALAQALLDHFISAGALVAATTHYAELKTYAHNTPQARNASVEFDLETLSPTYRLRIGLPGTRQAFAIAERLGLRAELVADARSRLGRAQQEFEQTLASIKEAQQTAEERWRAPPRPRSVRAPRATRRRTSGVSRGASASTLLLTARGDAKRALAEVQAEIAAARELLERASMTEARLEELAARLGEARRLTGRGRGRRCCFHRRSAAASYTGRH